MNKIQLWSVTPAPEGVLTASPVTSVENTDTEQKLEDLLVQSPDLLMENLNLIGRQIPTGGGFLDLLGIDQDGRVVIFELKRGTLTREAVAQILDYGSDLSTLEAEKFARLVEQSSGRDGIESIEDFPDWYAQEYPNATDALAQKPKLVLVGLGADDRARRIVNFLAGSGIDIQLLTFQAFQLDGKLLFARQVETTSPTVRSDSTSAATKEGNRRLLHEAANSLKVREFLEQVREFIEARMPTVYCWPGKTAYSFSLQEQTDEGKPTLRSYLTLYLKTKELGSLLLVLAPRAADVASGAIDEFCTQVSSAVKQKNSYSALEVKLTAANWSAVVPSLDRLLTAIMSGWKNKWTQAKDQTEDASGT